MGLKLDLGNILTYHDGAVQLADQIGAAGRNPRRLHLKDMAARDGGWVFVAVGQGDIPYADLLDAVPPNVPLGLEMPLRLGRPGKADPVRRAKPASVAEIEAAVRTATRFVLGLEE